MKKFAELLTVILFCVIVASLSLAFVFLPDKAFSEQENRNLASFPVLNSERFFSGAFGEEMNVYVADQFPLRDGFVKLKSAVELGFFKGENNGVLYSYDQLAVKDFNAYKSILEITENTDRIYIDSVTAQIDSLARFGEQAEIPVITMIPPRTIDIADSMFRYDRPDGDLIYEIASSALKNTAGYVDMLTLLREKFDAKEYVYYRTDHHWTTLGAYYAYCEIMKSLGKEEKIIPQDRFEIEQTDAFSGTTAARANFPFCKKDVLEIWHLPDDGAYEVIADGENIGGFYARDYLSKSDKYSVFLDGTHNLTTVKKHGEERETLLVAKDSFANCLIPFLAREYDIVAVNIHTVNAISVAAETYGADAVLIVCNGENLITTGDLGKIK